MAPKNSRPDCTNKEEAKPRRRWLTPKRLIVLSVTLILVSIGALYIALGWPYCFGSQFERIPREPLGVELLTLLGWKGRDERDLRCLLTHNLAAFMEAANNPSDGELSRHHDPRRRYPIRQENLFDLTIRRSPEIIRGSPLFRIEPAYVEFEDGLCGLRYYPAGAGESFQEGDEYIQVHRLDEHWWAYERDWN